MGVLTIIYNIPLVYFLLPGYLVASTLTLFASEDYVSVAWDSAGVTTGPVTTPMVLALGVSLGNTIGTNGFGILALASIGPILSVLAMGVTTQVIGCVRKVRPPQSGGYQPIE